MVKLGRKFVNKIFALKNFKINILQLKCALIPKKDITIQLYRAL